MSVEKELQDIKRKLERTRMGGTISFGELQQLIARQKELEELKNKRSGRYSISRKRSKAKRSKAKRSKAKRSKAKRSVDRVVKMNPSLKSKENYSDMKSEYKKLKKRGYSDEQLKQMNPLAFALLKKKKFY